MIIIEMRCGMICSCTESLRFTKWTWMETAQSPVECLHQTEHCPGSRLSVRAGDLLIGRSGVWFLIAPLCMPKYTWVRYWTQSAHGNVRQKSLRCGIKSAWVNEAYYIKNNMRENVDVSIDFFVTGSREDVCHTPVSDSAWQAAGRHRWYELWGWCHPGKQLCCFSSCLQTWLGSTARKGVLVYLFFIVLVKSF